MAQGDITIFKEFYEDLGEKVHDLENDTFKLGIVDDTITPTASRETPTWSDFSANEVGTGGNYTADGETLTTTFAVDEEEKAAFDATDVSFAQNASGFTDAYWGIIYNATHVNGVAIAFIDLGGPLSEVAGPVNIYFSASGIFTISV